MDPLALSLIICVMMVLAYLQKGREREATLRCTACGTRVGEKHHDDCHYKDKGL